MFYSFCTLSIFHAAATTGIYTLSLHDALPIWTRRQAEARPERHGPPEAPRADGQDPRPRGLDDLPGDRKSTRLNSSHSSISYAVFCLKKKIAALVRERQDLSVFRQSREKLLIE